MKKLLLSVVFLSSLFIFGCKNSSENPKGVLIDFFDAMGKEDFVKAKKLSTKESQPMLELMESAAKMDTTKESKDKYDKSKMEFGEAVINGDKATVSVNEKGSKEKINFSLKKEDGAWKVAFDKASLFNLGADALKNEKIDSKEIDQVVDSIKDQIDESLKKIDTAN